MRFVCVLLTIGGCAAGEEPTAPSAEVGDAPDRAAMQLRVVGEDGAPQPVWTDKSEVFLGLVDAVEAEYAFRVIDEHGAELSLDDPACRRFRVERGQLASTCHRAGTGTLQLMPFADAEPDDAGTMHFILQIAPADTSFDASSLKATFAIAAWPSS